MGAFIVDRIGRKSTLIVVSLLCLGQFVWTMHEEFTTLGWTGIAVALTAVGLMNLGFGWLWRVGDRLERRSIIANVD
jgi:uncharacterized protein